MTYYRETETEENIVWVVTVFQKYPVASEYIHSIHETQESAEMASEDVHESLGSNYTTEIEAMPLQNLEYPYEESH